MRWRRTARDALALGVVGLLSACQPAGGPSTGDAAPAVTTSADQELPADRGHKVLLLMEENSDVEDALRPGAAPYLQSLLDQGATLTSMTAGYPAECTSLPAYLLLTSGSTHGACDNRDAEELTVEGDNVFAATAATGREWRVFAESMDEPCRRTDTDDDRYLVRHTAAPYYATEAERCLRWQVPLGAPDAGELAEAVASGLPAFSLVVPDRCADMHGGAACTGDRVDVGDRWLQAWLPAVLGGADYRSGELLVILTWDEARISAANQIPTLVLHPDLAGTRVEEPRDHCSTLRTMTDWLGLDPLGCAAGAEPLVVLPRGRSR